MARIERPTAGRLGEAHRLGDRRLEHGQVVALPDVGEHLRAWLLRPSKSVGRMPQHLEVPVEDLLHVGDGVEQLADAAVAEHLARHGDDQPVGGGERVERQHAEARRAVEQHDVVCRRHRPPSAVRRTYSRPGRGRSCASAPARSIARGHEVDAVVAVDDDVGDARRRPSSTSLIERLDGVGVDAEARRSGRPAGRGRRAGPACPARRTRHPGVATEVVLATPPFWLARAIDRGAAVYGWCVLARGAWRWSGAVGVCQVAARGPDRVRSGRSERRDRPRGTLGT